MARKKKKDMAQAGPLQSQLGRERKKETDEGMVVRPRKGQRGDWQTADKGAVSGVDARVGE